MSFVKRIRRQLEDPYKSFRVLEVIIAAVCMTLPIWLYLADDPPADGSAKRFRGSISDYVYMNHSYVFGMLLTIAAMLFIVNGAVYFKKQEELVLGKSGKWYNILLGLFLFGVILFPHEENPIPHYAFAILFFAGNAVVTALFHARKYRVISIVLAVMTVVAFLVTLCWPEHLSLFWSEWISLVVIGVHLILQALKVISYFFWQKSISIVVQ